MKNSGLRVSATERNSGRSARRPIRITAPTASAAGATVSASRQAKPLGRRRRSAS